MTEMLLNIHSWAKINDTCMYVIMLEFNAQLKNFDNQHITIQV